MKPKIIFEGIGAYKAAISQTYKNLKAITLKLRFDKVFYTFFTSILIHITSIYFT